MKLQGVYLPLITPFKHKKIDIDSYKKLINYYINKGISGIIPLATTGEYPTVEDNEFILLIEKTIEFVENRIPVFIGVSGNDTNRLIKKIKLLKHYNIAGILCAGPYYNLPDQRGIYEHFLKLSEASELYFIIYNIPYRTGRNIENRTIRRLAELKNIIGLKDSCGSIEQTADLLLHPPVNFSILTGHDTHYYLSLALGSNGGILASAHINTEQFLSVYNHMQNNDHSSALTEWRKLIHFIPYLFQEPNPAPIKYILHRMGLIKSSEVRLPLVDISEDLQKSLLKAVPEI